ncbi:MAG: class I SAM-dependent methyltransferase [Thermoplasmata archaeon]
MSVREVAGEFDRIAPVYDATRPPLPPSLAAALAAALAERSVRTLLEVGVGTGRVARPLAERGFELTGIDASLGMLSRARAKGVERLVRASAYRLPFRDGAFDAALFVHVLHTVDDPAGALREACRAARSGAYALMRDAGAGGPPSSGDVGASRFHDELARVLREEGYSLPPRPSGGPWVREREILASIPPTELWVLSEGTERIPPDRWLRTLELGGYRAAASIPPEVLRRAAARLRDRIGTEPRVVRRRELLARWSPEDAAWRRLL